MKQALKRFYNKFDTIIDPVMIIFMIIATALSVVLMFLGFISFMVFIL